MNIQHCIDRLIEERDTYARKTDRCLYDEDIRFLTSCLQELEGLEMQRQAVLTKAKGYWDSIC